MLPGIYQVSWFQVIGVRSAPPSERENLPRPDEARRQPWWPDGGAHTKPLSSFPNPHVMYCFGLVGRAVGLSGFKALLHSLFLALSKQRRVFNYASLRLVFEFYSSTTIKRTPSKRQRPEEAPETVRPTPLFRRSRMRLKGGQH
jgi:hypothetical protein